MKKTVYKIIKKTDKTLIVDDTTGPEVKISTWYIARRKGRILGFWHVVGHEDCMFTSGVYSHRAKTIKEMESYLASYNEVYNNDRPYQIIYPTENETHK